MQMVSRAVRRAFRVSLCIVASSVLLAASPQQKTTTQTRKTPQLTPEEKEAQKHYRVAQEALKSNDLATAADELKTASTLAPNNALILYNLAVVESKRNDPDSALEHLHKAMSLGLPVAQQDDAEQLDAKLSYSAKRKASLQQQSETLMKGLLGKWTAESSWSNGRCNDQSSIQIDVIDRSLQALIGTYSDTVSCKGQQTVMSGRVQIECSDKDGVLLKFDGGPGCNIFRARDKCAGKCNDQNPDRKWQSCSVLASDITADSAVIICDLNSGLFWMMPRTVYHRQQ